MSAPKLPLDLTEELARLATARVVRLRHKGRDRAAFKVARDAGLKRRYAEKSARIRQAREQRS